MTEKLTAYTPLESLLLFQSLASNGVEPAAFSRTSDFLNNNPHIRNAKAYDSGRLSPDALRELYLSLLKEEAKAELDESAATEGQESNGVLDGPSRKRKRSPSLLSVQEASKHEHLIPQLIPRLYARYRELVVREIQEDERRYEALLREIEDIQEGRWDERLMRQDVPHAKKLSLSPARASRSPTVPNRDLKDSSDRQEAQTTASESARVPPQAAAAPEAHTVREEPNLAQVKIDAVINHPVSTPTSETAVSTTAASRVLPSPQQSPTQSDMPNQQPAPTPRLPPPRPSNSGYRLNSPMVHQSPYAPSPQPPIPGTSISPGQQPPYGGPDSRPSSSVVLPPPPGMSYLPPASNGPPYPGPVGYSPQQYTQTPPRYPVAPLAPNDGQHPHPPNQQSQYPSRSSMPPPHPPTNPPHSGGFMLPPFQLDIPTPGRPGQQQQTSPATTVATPSHASATPISSRPLPNRPEQTPTLDPHTPSQIKEIEHIAEMLAPQPPTPITKWRRLPQPPDGLDPGSPTRPPIESLSPMKSQQPLLEPGLSDPRPKQQRRRTRAGGPASEERTSPEEQAHDVGSRPKPGRTRNRKTRRGSVSSSAVASSVRGRTRSQSVISNAESSTQDTEPPSQRTVKPEPPSTPAGSGGLSDIAASESTPTEVRVTRRRGGTVQSTTDTAQKRKRPAREMSESSQPTEMPPSGSDKQYIVASRNFQRTSLTIMNDIASHKYASDFAQPVTERKAEGYHDIIYRGQDLRTIKGLIAAGSKTIGNMTSSNPSFDASQPSVASPGGPSNTGTIVVPANPSLMPPNAIVNSSQFEKEIMRMFANAVMFSPGDEGMVKDAREMAEDVQRMVTHWRGAERTQTGTPVHTGARGKGEDEEEGVEEETVSKRRKL